MNEFAEENDFTTLHYSNILKSYVKQKNKIKKNNWKNNIRWKKSSNPKEFTGPVKTNKQAGQTNVQQLTCLIDAQKFN